MNMTNVMAALSIMWKGMVGIFVTILIIMIAVWIMGKLGSKKQFFNWDENSPPTADEILLWRGTLSLATVLLIAGFGVQYN